MDLQITNIDFTYIYQVSMMIIGFGGLILGIITLNRNIKKEKQMKAFHNKRKRY